MKIVLLALAVLVLIVFVIHFVAKKKKGEELEEEAVVAPDADCCGAHPVCEKTEEDITSDPQLYYDDEELDNFRDAEQRDFQDNDIELFREILYTLNPKEILKWQYSLELRKVVVPDIIKEEARMLIAG